MKHYLAGDSGTFATFEQFDKELIRTAIIDHLKNNPSALVQHLKDWSSKKDAKKFYGKEMLNIYENNPLNNEPSLIITKGNHTFYKTIL
jgi:hypothetical protein